LTGLKEQATEFLQMWIETMHCKLLQRRSFKAGLFLLAIAATTTARQGRAAPAPP
jgi:hypothetical protein